MSFEVLKSLQIGDLTIKLPIIQGGMGIGISLHRLAAAVANEGGVGVIATAGIGMDEPDFSGNVLEAHIRALRSEIRKARELTKGILGVNIMVALTNFADLVKTSIEEGIDIIFSGAGRPLSLPQFVNDTIKTKLVPIVSSGRQRYYCEKMVDKYSVRLTPLWLKALWQRGHLGFRKRCSRPDYSLEKTCP
jgi:NAD(P)H-dependent flavin oxidoreductase YrpB (nitropropane dioxygenase family)